MWEQYKIPTLWGAPSQPTWTSAILGRTQALHHSLESRFRTTECGVTMGGSLKVRALAMTGSLLGRSVPTRYCLTSQFPSAKHLVYHEKTGSSTRRNLKHKTQTFERKSSTFTSCTQIEAYTTWLQTMDEISSCMYFTQKVWNIWKVLKKHTKPINKNREDSILQKRYKIMKCSSWITAHLLIQAQIHNTHTIVWKF